MTALITFLTAFLVSYGLTFGLLRSPLSRRFVDVPNDRSSHDAPKPRMGGVAIVVAFLCAFGYLVWADPGARAFLPFVGAALILFVTGLIDDRRGLGVRLRFGIQLVAAATVVLSGVWLREFYFPIVGQISLGWVGIPLTVLFILASINFYNFIDGIDGLAAGGAFIASMFLALIALMIGHQPLALMYVAVGAASLGFLQFNFPPSKLFMGDGGSTFLGFFFAYAALYGNHLSPDLPLVIPLLVLSSLYLDAGLTLFNRLVTGKNIFEAHHTHYYQRLLSLGFNHKQITLLEYATTTLLGISAVLYFKAGAWFAVFLCLAWLVLFSAMIFKIRGLERGDKLFWERRTAMVIAADVLMIVVAYVGAYFLRMNFEFTAAEGNAMLRALPIVVAVRTACFLQYGLYRTMWRYTSTADVARVIKAVTAGSALVMLVMVLLTRFESLPRTLFVIEYALLMLLVLGSRFGYRWFHEVGREAHGSNARRFAIVGADADAERLCRQLKDELGAQADIVCFIDDDPATVGLTLHGIPVVGNTRNLDRLAESFKLDVVAIGSDAIDDSARSTIENDVARLKLELRDRPSSTVVPGADLLAQRVHRELGWPLHGPSSRARSWYRGKRVLITHAGNNIGSSLATELTELGGIVTVQLDAPGQRHTFASVRGEVSLMLGSTRTRAAAMAMIEEVNPDAVFHCVDIDTQVDRAAEKYLWDVAIAGTEHLLSAAEGRAEAVTLVTGWGATRVGVARANLAVVAEALALNHTAAARSRVSVVRVPRVATEVNLQALAAGTGDNDRWFDTLERDISVAAINITAHEGAEVLFLAATPGEISARDLAECLTGPKELASLTSASRPRGEAVGEMVFPAEQYRTVGLGGVVAIESPIYPASDVFRKVLGGSFLDAEPSSRQEWVRVMTGPLYHLQPSAFRGGGE